MWGRQEVGKPVAVLHVARNEEVVAKLLALINTFQQGACLWGISTLIHEQVEADSLPYRRGVADMAGKKNKMPVATVLVDSVSQRNAMHR